ncbi:MAG: hypothetical protein ACK4P3_02120 [Fimbriimonadaceae bacterium]
MGQLRLLFTHLAQGMARSALDLKTLSIVLLAVVSLATAAALTGCRAATSQPLQPVALLLAFDTSGSFEPELESSFNAAGTVGAMVDPRNDDLRVFSFDTFPREVLSDPNLAVSQFNVRLYRELKVTEELGTNFVAILERLDRAAGQSGDKPAVVVIFTDGAPDGPLEQQGEAIDQALARLASNPKVSKVFLLGVKPRFREQWRDRAEEFYDKVFVGDIDQVTLTRETVSTLRTGARE